MKLRLFPLVMFAATSLLTLKAFDMILSGEGLLSGPPPAQASGAPEAKSEAPGEGQAAKKEGNSEAQPGTISERPKENIEVPKGEKGAESAINERLGEKRRALEDKEKEADLREELIKASENRLETKLQELKALEAKLSEAKERQEDMAGLKIKSLVIMYETMKPKEAAAIFDSLDMNVMLEVVSRMKPEVTSQILAKMQTASAQKLTVEMARRSLASEGFAASAPALGKPLNAKPVAGPKELPRIDTPAPK